MPTINQLIRHGRERKLSNPRLRFWTTALKEEAFALT